MSKELAGKRLAHDLEDLPEGTEIICNIDDAPILNPDGTLNEGFDDVLINPELKEKFK